MKLEIVTDSMYIEDVSRVDRNVHTILFHGGSKYGGNVNEVVYVDKNSFDNILQILFTEYAEEFKDKISALDDTTLCREMILEYIKREHNNTNIFDLLKEGEDLIEIKPLPLSREEKEELYVKEESPEKVDMSRIENLIMDSINDMRQDLARMEGSILGELKQKVEERIDNRGISPEETRIVHSVIKRIDSKFFHRAFMRVIDRMLSEKNLEVVRVLDVILDKIVEEVKNDNE